MHDVLVDALIDSVLAADEVGATFAVAEWECPGDLTASVARDRVYVAWINEVIRAAVGAAVECHTPLR